MVLPEQELTALALQGQVVMAVRVQLLLFLGQAHFTLAGVEEGLKQQREQERQVELLMVQRGQLCPRQLLQIREWVLADQEAPQAPQAQAAQAS